MPFSKGRSGSSIRGSSTGSSMGGGGFSNASRFDRSSPRSRSNTAFARTCPLSAPIRQKVYVPSHNIALEII